MSDHGPSDPPADNLAQREHPSSLPPPTGAPTQPAPAGPTAGSGAAPTRSPRRHKATATPTWGRATSLMIKVFLPMVARRGRLVATIAFAVVIGAVLFLLGRDSIDYFSELGFIDVDWILEQQGPLLMGFAVPIIALFAAAGGLAELISDETLLYVWLKPIRRSSIACASWLDVFAVAAAVSVPLSLVAMLSAVIGAPDPNNLTATLILASIASALLATAAYSALFTLLNSVTRFGSLIGAAYVLIWETLLAPNIKGVQRLSIGNYANALVANRGTLEDQVDVFGIPAINYPSDLTSIIVLVGLTLVGIGLTTWRLQRMDVD